MAAQSGAVPRECQLREGEKGLPVLADAGCGDAALQQRRRVVLWGRCQDHEDRAGGVEEGVGIVESGRDDGAEQDRHAEHHFRGG